MSADATEKIVITIVDPNKNTRKELSFDAADNPTFKDVIRRKGYNLFVLLGEDKPFSDVKAPLATLPTKTILKLTWWGKKDVPHPHQKLIDRQKEIFKKERARLRAAQRETDPLATLTPRELLLMSLLLSRE